MRRLRLTLAVALVLSATTASARRGTPPAFAEPSDIIAAEGYFTHLSAAKGVKAAIRATAAPDAQIFAPQLMRVAQYANRGDLSLPPKWHTAQVWMSCDGSVAVAYGEWQRPPALGLPALGWYVTVWKRYKNDYKWVLEQGGSLQAPLPASDMISAHVADCPARRARGATANPAPTPTSAKTPVSDYLSGHSNDGTLDWVTGVATDGSRSFVLQAKQAGTMREVLRAVAAPPGT